MKIPRLLAFTASFIGVVLGVTFTAPYAFANECPDGKSPVYMTTPSGKTKTLCVSDKGIAGLEKASDHTGLEVEIPCPCAIEGQFETEPDFKRCADHFYDIPSDTDRWLQSFVDVYRFDAYWIDQLWVTHIYDPEVIPEEGEYSCQGFRIVGADWIEEHVLDITLEEAEACYALIMDAVATFNIVCDL